MEEATGTDWNAVAAWWGATIGTLVLIWDIIKWKTSGARLQIRVLPRMKGVVDFPGAPPGATYILVEIVNNGDRPSTITHLFGQHYRSWWARLRGKTDYDFVVPDNRFFGEPLPYVLEPGQRWSGGIAREPLIEQGLTSGYLYVGIHHSASKTALRRRVELEVE